MEFKIPSKLQIGGMDFNVRYVPQIENVPSRMGQCDVISGEILIADNANSIKQSESIKVNTFFHELTHCILDAMGEYDLSHKEKFVCTFASLLTGAMRTME